MGMRLGEVNVSFTNELKTTVFELHDMLNKQLKAQKARENIIMQENEILSLKYV